MKPLVSVIVPTFGDAICIEYCIKSIQCQSVGDIEILVLCDGSSARVIELLTRLSAKDPRIKFVISPKDKIRGAERRHAQICKSQAEFIFYCCHGDIWFNNHVETLLPALENAPLAHTIQVERNSPSRIAEGGPALDGVLHYDLQDPEMMRRMLGGFNGLPYNFFGLSVAAHTRRHYLNLSEGWVNDSGDVPGDLYVWRQFLAQYGKACKSIPEITCLKFRTALRKDMTAEQRREELAQYFPIIDTPGFRQELSDWLLEYICHENMRSLSRLELLLVRQNNLNDSNPPSQEPAQ